MNQPRNDQSRNDQPATTPPVIRLAAAEVDVVAAKDRLNDTVARLQSKLDPKLLAKEATDEAKRVGKEGVTLARDNQQVLIGLAGGMILYLLRKPLFGLFRQRKYPKPQRAAKPMTATAPNERLARQPHPAQGPATSQPRLAKDVAPAAGPTLKTVPASAPAPVAASNEGAKLQGTNS